MGDIFQLADWVAGLLFAGALAMTALTQKELKAAKVMIWAALLATIIRWGLWAAMTDQPWQIRMIVGALLGAFLLAALPAAFHWINGQSEGAKAAILDDRQKNINQGDSRASQSSVVANGASGGITGGTVNIYNAPVTVVTNVTRLSTDEVQQMAANDKPPPPSVSVNSSPGSIIAPSGGNNSITNNFGPVARQLDSPWGTPLKAQILRDVPRDKPITVMAILGDGESIQLALQIHAFLKANNFKLREDGISQGVFTSLVKGLIVQPDGDGLKFIIGSNLP